MATVRKLSALDSRVSAVHLGAGRLLGSLRLGRVGALVVQVGLEDHVDGLAGRRRIVEGLQGGKKRPEGLGGAPGLDPIQDDLVGLVLADDPLGAASSSWRSSEPCGPTSRLVNGIRGRPASA